MRQVVLPPNANLGEYFPDFDSAVAAKPQKDRRLTGVKRPAEGVDFDPKAETVDTALLRPAKLPVALAAEEQNRCFYVRFLAKETPAGFDAVLVLDATFYAAEIYLNGRLLAAPWYVLSGIDLLLDGIEKENHLVICFPGNPEVGDVLLRGISLRYLPKSRFLDAYLRTEFSEGVAEITADFTVQAGDVASALGETVRMTLLDEGGAVVSESEQKTPLFERNYWMSVRLTATVENPRVWTPKDPFCYRVVLQLLRSDGEVTDTRMLRYGLRELRLTRFSKATGAAPRLLLNREPVKLFGVATDEQRPEMVKKIKTLGCNAVRLIDPWNKDFIDACEDAGLLVMCEASFSVRRNPRRRKKAPKLPDPLDRPLTLLGEVVARNKNRAAVFCWSLGSLGAFGTGVLREFVRSLDDTRAVNCEGDTRFVASDFFSAADCGVEELRAIAAGETLGDGRLFGNRMPFGRYMHRALLLTEVAPDAASLREKCAEIRKHDRLLGLFADAVGAPDFDALGGAFDPPEDENE